MRQDFLFNLDAGLEHQVRGMPIRRISRSMSRFRQATCRASLKRANISRARRAVS